MNKNKGFASLKGIGIAILVVLIIIVIGLYYFYILADNKNGLRLNPEKLLDGEVGLMYYREIKAEDLSPPILWLVTNGRLPPGLHLKKFVLNDFGTSRELNYATLGSLWESPSTPGTYSFTIRAISLFTGKIATREYTLKVLDFGPGLASKLVNDYISRNYIKERGGYAESNIISPIGDSKDPSEFIISSYYQGKGIHLPLGMLGWKYEVYENIHIDSASKRISSFPEEITYCPTTNIVRSDYAWEYFEKKMPSQASSTNIAVRLAGKSMSGSYDKCVWVISLDDNKIFSLSDDGEISAVM